MPKEKPLVNADYVLEKMSGKGGWTFAAIPEILQDKSAPFGWVKVKGSIDSFELKQYKLMPMGNGQLFLPVKAAIRKNIKKEAGDTVRVILYPDNSKLEIPQEIIDCFKTELPSVFKAFQKLSEGQQKSYLDWIYRAKQEETKTQRILVMMDRVARGLKYGDK